MEQLYENEEEALRHSTTIEGLAKSQGVRSDDVRPLYEAVLARMKRDAVIKDFLPIFAARQVKEILRRRGQARQEDYP
jgi:hypothetical protein